MNLQKQNTWLTMDGKDQADFYTSAADVIIIERKRTIQLILDLFGYHYEPPEGRIILDIGCGDGTITKHFIERFPNNTFYLMDGSEDMLSRAKESLKCDNVVFIKQTFEEYIDKNPNTSTYDFVFSSNAIHHLDSYSKEKFYKRIYHDLLQNGFFINIDLVLPSSERSEQLQFKMWIDWMNETLMKINLKNDVGKHDNLPKVYKSKSENQPSTLTDQMEMLGRAGFKDVDCFFKYSIFAMFGGIK